MKNPNINPNMGMGYQQPMYANQPQNMNPNMNPNINPNMNPNYNYNNNPNTMNQNDNIINQPIIHDKV